MGTHYLVFIPYHDQQVATMWLRSLLIQMKWVDQAKPDARSRFRMDHGCPRFFVMCLAHGHVLGIPVITDDADMLQVAKDFSIHTMKTLELMHLMLDCGYIDMEKVRQIVSYWEYLSDKPGGFRNDYIRLFGENPT